MRQEKLDGVAVSGLRRDIMPPSPGPIIPPDQFRFSVAPMMERTDRHCRYMHRLMSRYARLYTEMVVAQALHHAKDTSRWLASDPTEHPVAFQVGGADPAILASAAQKIAAAGFDEINLNVGCPSDRVSSGRFGACLMAEPELVADCVSAMANATDIPVTLKTRIGLDEDTGDDRLDTLVEKTRAAGCRTFVIHARNAVLQGLSPKENREIPPLQYERAYRLKRAFPDLTVIVNGGITSLTDARLHLEHVDGVMLGRAAYERPAETVGHADQALFNGPPPLPEAAVAGRYLDYAAREIASGARPAAIFKHAVNLFRDQPGARLWRQTASAPGASLATVDHLRRLLDRGFASETLAA